MGSDLKTGAGGESKTRPAIGPNRERRQLAGYLFAMGAIVFWSGNLNLARALNKSISPLALAFFRWSIASLAILPFAARSLEAEREAIRRNLPYIALTAALGVSLFNTLVYYAGRSTTALNLSLISITFPIFILIFYRLLHGERITLRKAAGIAMVALGVIYLVTGGRPGRLLSMRFAAGDVIMLGAAFTFALYSMLLKRRPEGLSLWSLQASTFIIGAAFLLPFFLAVPGTLEGFKLSPGLGAALLYVGIAASLGAFVMWNKAVEILGPVKAGMIYYSLPLVSGLVAAVFLGEEVGWIHVLSAALIVPGILVANSSSRDGRTRRGRARREG